jgi:hypothetical protein
MIETSSSAFQWDRETGIGTGFISDLWISWMGAASIFQVISTRTGAKLMFVHVLTDRDHEGEVEAWRYKSADGRFGIIIFND